MAKVIDTTHITGTVNRIFFNYNDTGVTSALLMMKGNPKIFSIPAHERGSPFSDSIKLTKPGDQVNFTLSVERTFMAGEYENLVSWTNETLEKDKNPIPGYKD